MVMVIINLVKGKCAIYKPENVFRKKVSIHILSGKFYIVCGNKYVVTQFAHAHMFQISNIGLPQCFCSSFDQSFKIQFEKSEWF